MCPGLRLCPHPSAGMWALTSVRSWLQRQGFYGAKSRCGTARGSQRQHRAAQRGLQGVKGHSALLGWSCCFPGWRHGKAQKTGRGRVGEVLRGTGSQSPIQERCKKHSVLPWPLVSVALCSHLGGADVSGTKTCSPGAPVPRGRGCCFPSAWSTPPSQQPLPNPGCFSRFSSNSDSSLNPSLALSLRCSSSETSEQLLSIHFSSQSCTVA